MYNFEDQKHLDGSAPKESNPIPQKRPPSKTVEQKVHQDENVADNKTTGSYQILLKTISETLYQIKYQDGDPTLYLEFEINFKEFELILLQLANLVCKFVLLFQLHNLLKRFLIILLIHHS